jgi:DNA-binding transcriptional LysR family regulator
MTLEDLRAFATTYRAKSMSEAARELGCTQGAVAQHVRRLEQELGTELFVRMRRGVSPTPSGEVLYRAAHDALASLEQAQHQIQSALKLSERKLRLTTSAGIVNRYLRKAILTFSERHPRTSIEIESEHTTESRLKALREGRADLALIPLIETITGLEVRPSVSTPLALLVHPTHPFAGRPGLEPAELASIRYLAQSPSSATFRHVERALREAGVSLSPSQIVEDAATANLMVELGSGETFVPAPLARSLERTLGVKAVALPCVPPLQMAWVARSFALLPSNALEFIELCEEIARRYDQRRASGPKSPATKRRAKAPGAAAVAEGASRLSPGPPPRSTAGRPTR